MRPNALSSDTPEFLEKEARRTVFRRGERQGLGGVETLNVLPVKGGAVYVRRFISLEPGTERKCTDHANRIYLHVRS